MTYAAQAAGRAHAVTVEMRVASGGQAVTFSSAPGASYPLAGFSVVGSELNPLTCRRTLAGAELRVVNTAPVQALMAPAYLVQVPLAQAVGLVETTLRLSPGDGAKLTTALGAPPFNLHVGAESVTVNAVAAGPEFDELTVVRGAGVDAWRTDPAAHPAGTPCGASPQAWPGRFVSEYLIYPNGDERLVALYACDGLPSYADGVWRLPLQDALGYYNRTLGRGLGATEIADGRAYGDATLNGRGLLLAGDRFASEDALVGGTYHLVPSAFAVGGDRLLVSAERTGSATGQKITAAGQPDAYFWPLAGRFGPIVDRLPDHGEELEPRIIVENAAHLVVLALLNSALGDGSNGAWDFLHGNAEAQIGAGVPDFRIDGAAITRALAGLPRWRVVIEPGAKLLDVIEAELAHLGLYLDVNESGLLTVREVHYPVTTQECVHQLTDDSLTASATEELRTSGRLVSRLTLRADFDALDEEHRLEVNLPGGLTPENQLGDLVEFAPTWLGRPTLAELEVVEAELAQLFARWGAPRPQFVVEHDWTKHLVRVGDTAAVVNPRLPDGAGGQGVAVGCLVVAVEADLESGAARITCEAVGSTASGYVCPAGEVQAVNPLGGGVYELTLAAAGASRLASGLLESGAEADEAEYFAAGWAVHGYDYAAGTVGWTGEVVAVAGAVLTVSTAGAPAVGEVVTPREYGTFGSAPQTLPPLDPAAGNARPGLESAAGLTGYLWLADNAATLGGAADDAKVWL